MMLSHPPTTRRHFIAATAGLAASFTSHKALAQTSTDTADFLFVQTAGSMAFAADASRMTLHDISPSTLFFSDRPERIAGNMSTERFVPFWSEGTDSFLSDPPNADLSMLEDGVLKQVVVELRDPVLEGDALHYMVKILEGEMPVLAKDVSLFIDVIGMPLTPVSFAGARRRAFRRAAIY